MRILSSVLSRLFLLVVLMLLDCAILIKNLAIKDIIDMSPGASHSGHSQVFPPSNVGMVHSSMMSTVGSTMATMLKIFDLDLSTAS